MNNTEAWNRRLKKAAIAFRTSEVAERKERFCETMDACIREAAEIQAFLPWVDAVERLELNQFQQMLLCVLWAAESERSTITIHDFVQIYEEVTEEELLGFGELPAWIYEAEGRIVLSPVL